MKIKDHSKPSNKINSSHSKAKNEASAEKPTPSTTAA